MKTLTEDQLTVPVSGRLSVNVLRISSLWKSNQEKDCEENYGKARMEEIIVW